MFGKDQASVGSIEHICKVKEDGIELKDRVLQTDIAMLAANISQVEEDIDFLTSDQCSGRMQEQLVMIPQEITL